MVANPELDSKMDSDAVKVEKKKVQQAVSVIYKLLQLQKDEPSKNVLLSEDHEKISLELTLKMPIGITVWKQRKILKVPLPHPFIKEEDDIALIVKDLDPKAERPDDDKTIYHYEDLLKECKIKFINKVIPIHQLKIEHLTSEAKEQFLGLHDILLVDSRVKSLLPSIMGSALFKKKKMGRNVSVHPDKLKKSLVSALKYTEVNIPSYGTCCSVQVGTSNHSTKEIIQNINAVVAKLEKDLPGGFNNIRELNVKATNVDMKIPMYINLGSRNEVKIEKPKKAKSTAKLDIVDTVLGAKVKVTDDFKIKVVPQNDLDSDMEDYIPKKKTQFKKRKFNTKKKAGKGDNVEKKEGNDSGTAKETSGKKRKINQENDVRESIKEKEKAKQSTQMNGGKTNGNKQFSKKAKGIVADKKKAGKVDNVEKKDSGMAEETSGKKRKMNLENDVRESIKDKKKAKQSTQMNGGKINGNKQFSKKAKGIVADKKKKMK